VTKAEQAKIRAYLSALGDNEHRYTNRDDFLGRVQLRLRELNWTLSRAARNLRDRIAPVADPDKAPRPAWKNVAAPAIEPEKPIGRPRLLLDVTSTLRSGRNTGIQRVAREIAREGWAMGEGIPVAIHNGRLFTYYPARELGETIEIDSGDVFVMLDATWNHLDEYLSILEAVKAKGGRSIVCLYDILPLLYPDAFPSYLVTRFENWLTKVVLESDGVIADSRAAAMSLLDHLSEIGRTAPALPIGWWRLGANFPVESTKAASGLAARIAQGNPYFVSVGTVEPRKGYTIVLDALERLWAEGVDATYVLIGARGWGMQAFERRLKKHPEFGRRLFWLDRASDADLALLYRNARAMILASVAEGFGLPIVEAARYGTPVIATDIEVFHEVGGDSAQYFDLLDRDSLAARMAAALNERPPPPVIATTSWRESAEELLARARDADFQMPAQAPGGTSPE
jgi:glycosyltransferase involved in cell wall biosynthesis